MEFLSEVIRGPFERFPGGRFVFIMQNLASFTTKLSRLPRSAAFSDYTGGADLTKAATYFRQKMAALYEGTSLHGDYIWTEEQSDDVGPELLKVLQDHIVQRNLSCIGGALAVRRIPLSLGSNSIYAMADQIQTYIVW